MAKGKSHSRRTSTATSSAKPQRRMFRALAEMPGQARTILYVHGIGNKPVPSILKCQWDRALFGFDLGERSRLAYWVNRAYYPDPATGTCDTGDVVAIDADPIATGPRALAEMSEVAVEQEIEALTNDRRQRNLLRSLARRLDAEAYQSAGLKARPTAGKPAQEAGLSAREVEAKILPLPPALRLWLTRRLTKAFVRDLHDYLFVRERRAEMRERVLERLRAGGGPFVVIAHSQGSMIAYDALQSLARGEADVRLFVTVGSPLGLAEVQDRVKQLTNQRTLAVPSSVARWINVADPLDIVAADKRLADDFTPKGAIRDDVEWNRDSPRHPHSGSGYLRTEVVQAAVRREVDTALFQPVASFVIARDVSRDLEDHHEVERHPVLIELVEPDSASRLTLDEARRSLVATIRRVAKSDDDLVIDELKHYVAARLTRSEAERLASEARLPGLAVKRIWRNAAKHALLEQSIETVQAATAHAGYRALGRNIVWAVVDSGINPSHPHFKAYENVGLQFDCTRTGPLTAAEAPDRHGHGTHVSGIIAGRHVIKNRTGERLLSGMAPATRLHIYKALDDNGNGADAWIIKALDHIFETNDQAGQLVVHGLNLSLGGGFDPSVYGCGHSPICTELRRLWRQGVLVVIAAGNEGFAVLQSLEGTIDANIDLSISDPANLDEAIAVGSVHKTNPHTYGVSYFSSRGPTADGRQKPDVVAPGERILSCRHLVTASASGVEDLYVERSGTSMAAPHVSGVLAAFLSVRREFIGYPDRVKEALLEGCTDLRRDRPQQGAGLPNLMKMLLNT